MQALWPPRRRFLTVNFLCPAAASVDQSQELIPLVSWDPTTDDFVPPAPEALADIAGILGIATAEFTLSLRRRAELMKTLSEGHGVGMQAMRDAMEEFLTAPEGQSPETGRPECPE